MSFKIGDVVYGINGIPGIVKGQDKVTGDLTVDIDKSEVSKVHKYGYINGLDQKEREIYTKHLDEVHDNKEPKEKVESIREKIAILREDPSKIRLVKYLESELFHIMNTHNISPRFYNIETPKAPVNKF